MKKNVKIVNFSFRQVPSRDEASPLRSLAAIHLLFFNVSFAHFVHLNLICGLYYKPMMILNDDSRVVNKLETLLNDYARVIIYDCHMFIVPVWVFLLVLGCLASMSFHNLAVLSG
jgi:hypothetical protein